MKETYGHAVSTSLSFFHHGDGSYGRLGRLLLRYSHHIDAIGIHCVLSVRMQQPRFFGHRGSVHLFFHVGIGDLHYYLAEDEIHKMNTRRKRTVLFYRFLLLVVADASAYYFMSLFEKSQTDKSGAHLFLAVAWAIIFGLFNLAMAAFLERRYRKNYGE